MITALSALRTYMEQHDPTSYRWAYVLILTAAILIVREAFLGSAEKKELDKLNRAEDGETDNFREPRR